MDFRLSEEEDLFRASVKEFCEKNITPVWVDIDEKGEIPVSLIKAMADQGLIAPIISSEYGGSEGSCLMAALSIEEIAYAEPSVSTAVYLLLHTAWPFILQQYGSEDAKREILPKICKGEGFFGIASTESQGGSDVSTFRTLTAKQTDNKKWILNGEKVLISGMDNVKRLPWGGGWFTIARSGSLDLKHKTLTAFAFLAKKNGETVPGYEYSNYPEIGRHGIHTGGINLSSIEIEDKYRIGEVNEGFKLAMEGFNLARCLIGGASIGVARWVLDYIKDWIKERKVWGKPLAQNQGISFKYADLYAEVEAARLLVYKAAQLADRFYLKKDPTVSLTDVAIASACAKLKAPEIAVRTCEEALKIYGGMGYFKEVPLYRAWLGIFSYVIGAEGAQNIMRYIIARNIIGADYVKI